MAFQLRVYVLIIDGKAHVVHTRTWNNESKPYPVATRHYYPAPGFKLSDVVFENLLANTHSSKLIHRSHLCTLKWLKLALKVITPLVLAFLSFVASVSATGED